MFENVFKDYLTMFLDSFLDRSLVMEDSLPQQGKYFEKNRFRYDGVDSGTTESIPVLQDRFLYYRIDSCTTESIPILKSRLRYYGTVSDTAESITVYRDRRKIRAPKISFGVTRKRNDNQVMISKHIKIIIEWSSGFMKIDVGPMGQQP